MRHLILGNGPAGVVAAETLRRLRPQDEILVYGCEGRPPYSRMAIPYLLEGQIKEPGTYLRKAPDHFARAGIELREGRAVSLDAAHRRVLFADGHFETFDRLLIATGSTPIRPPIPGNDLPGVTTCWTLEDARRIQERLHPGARVVQLGAGFIGCIILESLVKAGAKLTLVEMGDRLVPRMLTPRAGTMLREWVEKQGVAVRTNTRIEAIHVSHRTEAGLVERFKALFRASPTQTERAEAPLWVTLSSGEVVPADLVIIAAGVRPNLAFLEGTPVHVASGVLVDATMQSSVPGVYAAGDCAEAPDLFTGQHLVAAIQPNAADEARVAATNMAGGKAQLPGVLPLNVLDTLGLISTSMGQWQGVPEAEGGSHVEWVNAAEGKYLSLQFQHDRLIGATAVGLTEHVGALRGLIQGKVRLGPWHERLLANPLRFVDAYVATTQQPAALVA